MSSTEHDDRWPHIAALLAKRGGQIMLGRVAPIEGAAVATDEQALFATLVRREGESVNALLQRHSPCHGITARLPRARIRGAISR